MIFREISLGLNFSWSKLSNNRITILVQFHFDLEMNLEFGCEIKREFKEIKILYILKLILVMYM